MKKFLLFIICTLLTFPVMGQQKKAKKKVRKPQYVKKVSPQKIEHDTMSASITLADSIVYEASKHLGKPYRLGTKGPNVFDCSGFTGYVFKQLGFNLAYTSREQYKQGIKVSREHIHKGDLVFFTGRDFRGGVGHVGIVFDVNKADRSFRFIHASTSRGIFIQRFPDTGYYNKRLIGFRRMADVTSPAPLPADNTFYSVAPPPVAIATDENEAEKLKEKVETETATKHVVKKGETIASIAKKYGYSTSQIKKWNKLEANARLKEGQTIIIRNDEPKPSDAITASIEKAENEKNATASNFHIVVQEGETVYSLSEKFNCTVKELATWNNLKNNEVAPGQELIIRPVPANAVKDTILNEELVHTVQTGENIFQIARKYGCQVNELRTWNGLKDNVVKPGEKLTIKRADKNGVHSVSEGETIESICHKYGCTIAQLKEWNNLVTNSLRPGRILKVRQDAKSIYYSAPTSQTEARLTAQEEEKKSTQQTTGSDNDEEYEVVYYTVKNGDYFGKIAKANNCTVKQLQEWNKGVNSTKLRTGMKLVIKKRKKKTTAIKTPATQPEAQTETKASIVTQQANAETATLNDAQENTNKQTNTAQDADYIYHTVKGGDTFRKIANQYGCTTSQLLEWNNLRAYKLKVGGKMIVGRKQKNISADAKEQAVTNKSVPNTSEKTDAKREVAKQKTEVTGPGKKEVKAEATKQKEEKAASTTTTQETTAAKSEVVYIVKNGDNLYNIARRNGCTIKQLMEWNNLKNDKLRVKQKLIIKK